MSAKVTVEINGKKYAGDLPPIAPTPAPTPAPAEEIVVTPKNYKSLLKNIGNVNFGGSTEQYVQVTADQVRLELPCGYENVEISGRVKIVKAGTNQRYLIQLYGRGGHHGNTVTVPMPDNTGYCMGCCYKGRFLNTNSLIVKEVTHPAYCANRVTDQEEYPALVGRWAEVKTTIVNTSRNDVQIKNYVDNKLVGETIDSGNWSYSGNDFTENCAPRRYGNTGKRQRDEILNKPGVLVAWRTDGGTIWQFEWLKARKL